MEWLNITFWVVGTLITVLGPLVLIHELGHFVSAKLAGVRVEEFGFGFPPRLLGLWRGKGYLDIGDTRVHIPRHIELGSMGKLALPVRLLVGSHIDALAQRQEDGSYLLQSFDLLDSETQDTAPLQEQVEDGVRIRGEVTEIERGTLYSLNWLPMGAFVKMTGEEDPSDPRSLATQPKRWRITVVGAGIVLNIIAAFILMTSAYVGGIPEKWTVQIGTVIPQTAAAEAGLQSRDVILAIDGEVIEEGPDQLMRIVQAAPEETLVFSVLRRDETIELEATPRARVCGENEPYCIEGTGFLGIEMAVWPIHASLHRSSIPEAVQLSINDFGRAAQMLIELPGRIMQGEVSAEEVRPTSVIGASQILTFFLQQSIEWRLAFPVLHAAALISLALGLTNLLPLPGLDGGRILFIIIEIIRGRRISPEREAIIHVVGLAIMVFLMVLVMMYDFINPIISWSLLNK
jgi:regulator of sigma E protease